jgi:hypothetical protein
MKSPILLMTQPVQWTFSKAPTCLFCGEPFPDNWNGSAVGCDDCWNNLQKPVKSKAINFQDLLDLEAVNSKPYKAGYILRIPFRDPIVEVTPIRKGKKVKP